LDIQTKQTHRDYKFINIDIDIYLPRRLYILLSRLDEYGIIAPGFGSRFSFPL